VRGRLDTSKNSSAGFGGGVGIGGVLAPRIDGRGAERKGA